MKRQITIANTSTQKRDRFESEATTLGELKKELDARDISYVGMSFTEGLSKTVLISDDSILPSNIDYKGTKTNDLVILLTNTEKKISSGMDRKMIYQYIKDNQLQEAIRNKFGIMYTNVSTADLNNFLKELNTPSPVAEPEDTKDTPCEKPSINAGAIMDWFYSGIAKFLDQKLISTEDVKAFSLRLSKYTYSCQEEKGIRDSDVDAIMRSLY